MTTKKGQADPMKVIGGIIVVIVVIIILIIIYRGWINSANDQTNNLFCSTLDDCDGDGLKDIVDDCLCKNEDDCNDAEMKRQCREECNEKKESCS